MIKNTFLDMANETPISYIKIGEDLHPIDAVTLNDKSVSDFQEAGKIVQSLSASSTEDQIPSAACVYDIIYGGGSTPEPVHDYSRDYLTFEILSDGNIGWYFEQFGGDDTNAKEIEYSKNNGAWTPITASESDTIISVQTGDIIRFKGNNQTYTYWGDNDSYFNTFNNWEGSLTTAEFNICGNIMSLIYGDNFVGQTMLTSSTVFTSLFMRCQGLISAENLILPATTATYNCYSGMFEDCTSLIKAPELPATTLDKECYYGMFSYCSSLTTAPELPATTLDEACYQNMFVGCTNLTTAPELPATTLPDNGCYMGMFMECTSLTTAPELPATNLGTACYKQMFEGCTSLIEAPELPATTLVGGCYSRMFYDCTSLNYIKCLATDKSAYDCLGNWVYNVAASGTFVKDVSSSWSFGVSGIPSGWNAVNNDNIINS